MKRFLTVLILFVTLTCTVTQLASAGIVLWQATPGSSASTNWSDTANWSNGLGPVGNDAVFGDAGAAGDATTICSVVDHSSLNPLSLTFTNGYIGPTRYHTVLIPAAVAVTNANAFTVGLSWSPANYPTLSVSSAAVYSSRTGSR